MDSANPRRLQLNSRRRWKDKLAHWSVTSGGIAVLLALLLILFYLIYTLVPLFKQADVRLASELPYSLSAEPAAIGIDDNNQFVYRYSDQGQLTLFALNSKTNPILSQQLALAPTSFFALPATAGISAYGLADGRVQFQELRFISRYTKGKRSLAPRLLALDNIQLSSHPIRSLSFAYDNNHNQRVIAGLAVPSDQTPSEIVLRIERANAQSTQRLLAKPKDKLMLNHSGHQLFVLSDSLLKSYRLRQQEQAKLEQVVDIKQYTGEQPVGLTMLANDGILVRLASGRTTEWAFAERNGQKQLSMIREFATPAGAIAPEAHRNVFASLTAAGALSLWHAPSETQQKFTLPTLAQAKKLSFSTNGEWLVIEQAQQLSVLKVNNPHPDVNLRSLFSKIWHSGYSEPAHVWQSTAGLDNFEGKLNLVPLLFGTIKVALFSLIIAVPLALGSAIYTAYFMPAAMRRIIKPSIELMEALPTVILGFLAAVWLAPIVEQHLLAMAMLLIALPTAFVAASVCWLGVPQRWRKQLPVTGHLAILIPLILLVGYATFELEPWLEQIFLGGDAQTFITQVLGVGYDQRNALVVAIAMGFAVIPTIFTIAEDAIFSVPRHLTHGSLALGATPWQTLTRVVLLTASPGIFSAIMMGLGRAVGETMVVLMATGNTPLIDWNPFEGMRSLAANIAVEMPESEVGSSHYRVLFLIAFILFCMSFLFNSLAEFVRQRLRDKYRAL